MTLPGGTGNTSNTPENSNANAPNESQGRNVYGYAVKLPQFWSSCPLAYFEQVEAVFRTSNIRVSNTKYDHLLTALPPNVASDVLDVMQACRESETPYEDMKAELIKRNSLSEAARIEKLLSTEEMGSRSPSTFYRSMISTAGTGTDVNESLVGKLWLRRLPSNMQSALIPFKSKPIKEVLGIADAIYDAQGGQPSVNSVKSNSNSEIAELRAQLSAMQKKFESFPNRESRSKQRGRSKSRNKSESRKDGPCFYHEKFGDKARKCSGKPCPYAPSGN